MVLLENEPATTAQSSWGVVPASLLDPRPGTVTAHLGAVMKTECCLSAGVL